MYTQNDIDNMDREEKTEFIYNTMIELDVATHEELELVTGVSGYNLTTVENALYYKTGSHDIMHLLEDYDLIEDEY